MSDYKTTQEQELDFQSSWKLLPALQGNEIFNRLIANEFLSPNQLSAQLTKAIRGCLRYAESQIPYYQRRYSAQHITSRDFKCLADLSKFPILTRFNAVNEFSALQAADLTKFKGPVTLNKTSGSTGLPVKVLHTQQSLGMSALYWQRQARWYRLDITKRFARIRIPNDLFRTSEGKPNPDGYTAYQPRWMQSGLYFETGDEVHFNVTNPRSAQLDWLAEHKPAYLLTFPGLMEELALANDCKPVEGLSRLISIASMLTTTMRSRIEQALDVPIHQNYGLNEVGSVAARCGAGRYHIHPENAYIEIVDGDGIAVEPGNSGRLLVTALSNPAMPLIRYDTGDLATASKGPCPCGRTTPSFEDLLGRYIRFEGTPEGTRPRLNGLLGVLSSMRNEYFSNIRQYQIYQTLERDFEVRVSAAGPLHEEFASRLLSSWKELNGDGEQWKLTIVEVDEIASTPSGKKLDFVSAFQDLDQDFKK